MADDPPAVGAAGVAGELAEQEALEELRVRMIWMSVRADTIPDGRIRF